jgi:sugar phosphate isomerase/epimerase
MIPNNDLSFEMYSSRFAPTLEEQVKLVAEVGYTDVQPFFFGPPEGSGTIDAYVALLKHYGLTARSGHFTLDLFDKSPELVAEIAKAFGMGLVVMPWINPEDRPTTAAGWQAIGRKMAAHTEAMQKYGLSFAYHNHDFEMARLPDGSYPLEHVLGESVQLEPDLAWMVIGKVDPLAWIRKYWGRIPAVHVKDLAPTGENADEMGFADVGQGTMDWQMLWDACVAAGAQLMIAEHDKPSDWRRFARRSVEGMRRIGNHTRAH